MCGIASFTSSVLSALPVPVVVVSETARARLLVGYRVPAGRVVVVPRGAEDPGAAPVSPYRSQQRQVLTWGLLRPGKGIEWAVEAMALLDDLRPNRAT